MNQLGRITIYSIAGCPHCLAAKKRLKNENLQYFDVGVDRFPPHVRLWVQEKTGKTSVPQIFFNSRYIGGNKELQEALDNEEEKKELLDVLSQEASVEELPLLPNPGDALEDVDDEVKIDLEQDKYYPIIEQLIQSKAAGDNYPAGSCFIKLFSSPVKYSIPEGDLTKIISEAGNEDTKKVVEHLLEARLLREVPNHGDLLVVTGLEAMSNTQCLNTSQMSSSVLTNPDEMSQNIRNILLKLFSTFLSEDGGSVDYKGISKSKLFQQFKQLAIELQRVDLLSMSETQKIAFFINIYNALVIHGHVEKGVPTTTYARYKFFSGTSYNIGGFVFSLNDIENGILRSNRASMATLYRKPLSQADTRMPVILSKVEPRIHFALNCGAKSCPPIKTFSGDEVLDQLDVATAAFLENDDALYINEERTEVRLTQLFQWYQDDFGDNMAEVLSWILDHVNMREKKKALEELIQKNSYKVSYTPYDWGHNAKE